MNIFRDVLLPHSLVDLDGFLGRVTDHKAVRTLGDVSFEPPAQLDVYGLVEVIVEFVQELLTGKQKRRPLSA